MKITKATLGIDENTFEPVIKFEGLLYPEPLQDKSAINGLDATYRQLGEDFHTAIKEAMASHEKFKHDAGLV